MFLQFQLIAFSQVKEEWVRMYDGISNGKDDPAGLVVNNDGSIVVGGTSESNTLTDFVTIKYNSSGNTQWVKTYAEQIEDRLVDLCNDNSGNIYVTGLSENLTGTYDIITIKYNPDGDSLWVSRYDSAPFAMDQPTAITLGEDNFVYVTGYTFGSGGFMGNVTIKYDQNGNSVWVARTVNSSPLTTGDIHVDAQNNVYVYTRTSRCTIIKYNSNGDLQWIKNFDGIDPGNTTTCMAADNSGNIYFIGKKFTNTFTDFVTGKINSNGDTLWMRIYNGTGTTDQRHDDPRAICLDENGNVYVTGESQALSQFLFSTIKYNSQGVFQWEKYYYDPQNGDGGNSIAADNNGSVYITGGSNDMTTIKYSSAGDSLWLKKFDGPASLIDISDFIALDNNGNVYVSGMSRVSNTSQNFDIVTIKYSQAATGLFSGNDVSPSFELHQNYPNPFNPLTRIIYSLSKPASVTIKIFDMLGREVQTLLNNEFKAAGQYTAEVDGSNLSNGVYFYRMQIGDFVKTKNMILIK